jgi:DNA-binding MarR family transcriptional regulator
MFGRRPRASDEKRILDFLDGEDAVSQTPVSLAAKLNVDVRTVRRVLDDLVASGHLRVRVFDDIEPIYYRYPSLEERLGGLEPPDLDEEPLPRDA